ncbi:MAG: arginine--tRNA ligase [Leptospiraceae bacterium]|nr:arginine--tRNA ligase [Leptospiraceae bacterium]
MQASTQTLKEQISAVLEQALDRVASVGADRPPVRLEYARDPKFGDYACTVAMDKDTRALFSAVNPEYKKPRNFAAAIVDALQNQIPNLFQSVEIAGPGFINLRLSDSFMIDRLQAAALAGEAFGRSHSAHPRRIIFEFVSANPTGPLNIVSARAAALGDSCCNLLAAAGHQVHREFYVNDYGNQVKLLGQSSLLRAAELEGVPLRFAIKNEDATLHYPDGPGLAFPTDGYHGDYLVAILQDLRKQTHAAWPAEPVIERLRSLAASGGQALDWSADTAISASADQLGTAVLDCFMASQKADLERFNVRFDEFYRESGLHKSGAVLAMAGRLGSHVYTAAGKQLFRSTDFQDDKDRVIVRDDGRPTYLLADIAYHQSKLERGFDEIINIWGPDHHGYIARLGGAMQALGLPAEKFRVLIAQQVNLLDNGEPIKMSKRAGKVITMQELLDEVPLDVARYFFVMRSFSAHLDFDFAAAKDTSDQNPYYYVAYAHARIQSIFRTLAAERGLQPEFDSSAMLRLEWSAERRELLWHLLRFPEEIQAAAQGPEVHHLINYLYQIASTFSSFYNRRENRIKEQSDADARSLLALLSVTALVLRNGLKLLGMHAPDQM